MSLRRAVRLVGVAGGLGLAAAAVAQTPDKPIKPAAFIPPADAATQVTAPAVAKVQLGAAPVNGSEALPKALADARAAHAKLRDYVCHLVRQERVGGKLLPEQTAELRVRTQPFALNVRVMAPKGVAGQETNYVSGRAVPKVQFKAAGVEGVRGFVLLPADDPKVMAATRHAAPDTGLLAVVECVEKALAAEKKLGHPVQVLVADYTFADRPVTRFEVFADKQHPNRYAHRCVLYLDKATKLPARFEAYDSPKAGSTEPELLEVQNFVGLKTNTGLGAAAFER